MRIRRKGARTHVASVRYCCGMFQDLVESAGERGHAVVVLDGGKHSRHAFLLQSRATDAAQPFTEVTTYPVALVATMAISYCPCCGTELKRFYDHTSLPLHPELAREWMTSIAEAAAVE